jgi:hypothetical protein
VSTSTFHTVFRQTLGNPECTRGRTPELNCLFLSKSEASAFEVSGPKNPINLTCQA